MMSAAPTAPSGRWRMNFWMVASQPALGSAARVSSSTVCGAAAMLAIADARIDPPVGDVDHEIDDQEEAGDQQHQRLDERVVAARDPFHEPHSQPVEVEHLLLHQNRKSK